MTHQRFPLIRLASCKKGYTRDLDKVVSPAETIRRVRERLCAVNLDILAETRRADVGRLGIPVYLSVCGADARKIMPTRKQMGKGSSSEQAEASALMELMERFAFFSFWNDKPYMRRLRWSEAEREFGQDMLPLSEMSRSVNDALEPVKARRLLDIFPWLFYPATRLADGGLVWLPLDWFKLLGEFNGTSAGNTPEESLLQGISELVERHVCCLVDRDSLETPTIDQRNCGDPVLEGLSEAFRKNNIQLLLKDFSQGMPLPTVGAVAWDTSTFPARSEIVFTAGTAATPAKAAIRAVTEIAQLAGDFCTGACYEASGLSKFSTLDEIEWLKRGPTVSLSQLPNVEHEDIREELLAALRGLTPLNAYAVETTHPLVGIPTHYSMIPGLAFRERDRNQSLGLFVGRKLTEEGTEAEVRAGFRILEECCPDAHFLPFFEGMLAMRLQNYANAREYFLAALPRQPDPDAAALAAFYAGYTDTLENRWQDALPMLSKAFQLCPEMKEYANLLGVAHFRTGNYEEAAQAFNAALKIDKGSVMDIANLGLCHKFLGDRTEAAHLLRAALKIDPALGFAREHLEDLERE
ncbi:MAG: YcaO-like family protein [Desulfovibrio sp.]|jgi:ribosomal protein S12 methylthiotransferase accessory factor|nr:YcaO-like family protein [Desulfovibrio sp.]